MAEAEGASPWGDLVSGVPLSCADPLTSLSSPGLIASPLPESPRKTVMFAPYVASFRHPRGPRPARRLPARTDWNSGLKACEHRDRRLHAAPTGKRPGRGALAGAISGLEGAVVADGHAGAVALGTGAAEFDEAGDAVAVPGVGGEQFEHAR